MPKQTNVTRPAVSCTTTVRVASLSAKNFISQKYWLIYWMVALFSEMQYSVSGFEKATSLVVFDRPLFLDEHNFLYRKDCYHKKWSCSALERLTTVREKIIQSVSKISCWLFFGDNNNQRGEYAKNRCYWRFWA